jgi:hypothetical protein
MSWIANAPQIVFTGVASILKVGPNFRRKTSCTVLATVSSAIRPTSRPDAAISGPGTSPNRWRFNRPALTTSLWDAGPGSRAMRRASDASCGQASMGTLVSIRVRTMLRIRPSASVASRAV